MVSEAQIRATKKYCIKHYYNSNVHLPIVLEEGILNRIKEYGSFNAYIRTLVEKDLGK